MTKRAILPTMWGIRHKPTGHFIPDGYVTRNEPEPDCWPKLYPSKDSARRALARWAEGVWRYTVTRSYFGEYDSEWGPEKVASRNKDDMELVELVLMETV